MSYDIEFVQVALDKGVSCPIDAASARKLLKKVAPFADVASIKTLISGLEGAKPGPAGTINYVAKGLSFARFTVLKDRVHVDNNLNCAETLRVYELLKADHPTLLILDLQSGQIHDATSYKEWWSKPL